LPHKFGCRWNIDLDPARFANDAPEEFVDGAIVKRTGVEVLQARENVLLAIGVAKRQVGGFFERADLERESRSDVQKTQQFGINFIDFFTPMLYIHRACSVLGNKKTSRDFFRIAAGSFEGVVLAFYVLSTSFSHIAGPLSP
jgi:hypothetical protein